MRRVHSLNAGVPGCPQAPCGVSGVTVAGCRFAYTPKSRQEFWQEKFATNVQRDQVVLQQLTALGWKVITVWECELLDTEALQQRLRSELQNTPCATRWS